MTSLADLRHTLIALEGLLEQVLLSAPNPISEYDLLKQLQQEMVWPEAVEGSLGLFQQHFLLFHLLYRLQQRWWQAQERELSISPLAITLRPYVPVKAGLVEEDPLRDYYLDLEHLLNTDGEEVEQMLKGFWQRYLAADEHQEALEQLGLELPTDRVAVEQAYRRLAACHHPDRGGETARLVEINRAIAILRRYYPA